MSHSRERGFTLIEMIIAFAILGMSLTVLYGVFESALSRARHDVRLSQATLMAQSLIARAGTEWPFADGTQSGASDGYSYTIAEEPQVPPRGQPPRHLPMVQITVTVSWPEFAGARSVSLVALKWLPPPKS
jgi:general secretion pathway protein I